MSMSDKKSGISVMGKLDHSAQGFSGSMSRMGFGTASYVNLCRGDI